MAVVVGPSHMRASSMGAHVVVGVVGELRGGDAVVEEDLIVIAIVL
jgi:hypothetical protein